MEKKTCPVCGCVIDDDCIRAGWLDGEQVDMCEDCEGEYVTCSDCGDIIPIKDALKTASGDIICQSCYDDGYTTCEHCDDIVPWDDIVRINYHWRDEIYVCSDCADRCYYRCDECGEYYSYGHIAYNNDECAICESCGEQWAQCDNCGRIVHIDNVNHYDGGDCVYCDDCYAGHQSDIHDYDYKPCPEMHYASMADSENTTYGVELEVDDGDDANDLSQELSDLNLPIYCKRDGSLDDGLEIVTHPATLAHHMCDMGWDSITDACRDAGYKSHDTNTCGLHVHIGRAGHSDGWADKLTVLACALQDVLTTFSRRRASSLQRWAAWNWPSTAIDTHDDDESLTDTLYALLRDSDSRGRYQAVNRQNHGTVEVRIFRGTLKTATILATIQLVDMLSSYADTHTICECARTTWDDIKPHISSKELQEYCRNRGIL